NWLLAGCLEWQRNGLQPPAAVVEATDQYRSEMDVLAGFLADCCEQGIPEARVKANRLFQAFQAWCNRTGEQAGTATKFGLRLRERGIEKRRGSDGNHYVGIMLKPEGEGA